MAIYLVNIFSLIPWYVLYKKYENEENRRKDILIGICFQFIIVQGLRDFSVGSDTMKYMEYYNYLNQLNSNLLEIIINPPLAFETGYLILMKILGFLDLVIGFF